MTNEKQKTKDFVFLANIDPDLQKSVLHQMQQPKFAASDTMNFWMDIMLDELKNTIAMVDVLSINDEEARQLSGEYSLIKAAKTIQKMGPEYVIIKKGEHGALLFNKTQIFFAPALPLEEVFDPTESLKSLYAAAWAAITIGFSNIAPPL